MHTYLNIEMERGLSNCLIGEIDISEALIRTDIEKLSFLPAGKHIKNPAELLSSRKMAGLISEMKNRYPDRYIIIDTPPVLPFAEARSISTAVDGIIFVVREGIAPFQGIQEALDILKGGNMLGILYNAVSLENLNGYHKYYYKNYYKNYYRRYADDKDTIETK